MKKDVRKGVEEMLKVLIVDDMDIIRRELKRLKIWGEKTGFILSAEATNGQAALEVLKNTSVDLVITDIKMPKVDGLELLKKIVENHLCPCVVLLSDYTDFTYARQGLVLGAFDYMTKPVDKEEVLSLLKRVKTFIAEKNIQQDRLRNLEQNLVEQVEIFFPKADAHQMIELIEEGNIRCLEVAMRMIDITGANLGYNLLKVESVLKNVLNETSKILFQHKKWLTQFTERDFFEDISFAECKDLNEMKAVFNSRIEEICVLINLLQCGQRGTHIVSQVSECVLESPDEDLSLKTIAEKLFLNKTYISETFKQRAGIPLVEYLTRVKMEKAKKLLADGELKTYEVGNKLGYKDVEYFSKIFKKYVGVPPIEFRQNYKAYYKNYTKPKFFGG